MGLHIRNSASGDRAVLHLDGEIDLAESRRVQDAVLELLRTRSAVVVDLSAVTFLDATGLRALLRCRERARAAGGCCVLSSPSRCVRRLAGLTGTEALLGLTGRASG